MKLTGTPLPGYAVYEYLLVLHPHEELWNKIGNAGSVLDAAYPVFDGKYLVETTKDYPVSINGKLRSNLDISLDATEEEVKKRLNENPLHREGFENLEWILLDYFLLLFDILELTI